MLGIVPNKTVSYFWNYQPYNLAQLCDRDAQIYEAHAQVKITEADKANGEFQTVFNVASCKIQLAFWDIPKYLFWTVAVNVAVTWLV